MNLLIKNKLHSLSINYSRQITCTTINTEKYLMQALLTNKLCLVNIRDKSLIYYFQTIILG